MTYKTWTCKSISVINKALRNETILRLPNIDVNNQLFYRDYCQIGKQTRSPHKSVRECYTNKVL